MEFGKGNYFRFSRRKDFLSSLRFIRAALVDGESNIQRKIAAKIIITTNPASPCKNKPLFIPPSIGQLYLNKKVTLRDELQGYFR
jgi:hypothetical protein